MKLQEIKEKLPTLESVTFQLPNGEFIPKHFHVTEVGIVSKRFIDCGGTIREEKVVNFQLWSANDTDHRLQPEKLLKIIKLSEEALSIENWEVEVEYQSDTIGKYGLAFSNGYFQLTSKQTDCLAKDNCGVPQEKTKIKLKSLTSEPANACCGPSGNCC